MPANDLIDWSFDSAPEPDDAPPLLPPPAPPAAPRRRLPRWGWLALGALPVLAVLFAALSTRLQSQRIQEDVARVVAQQEQARVAGDWITLQSLFVDSAGSWASHQVSQMRNSNSSIPINLPIVSTARQPGAIGQFQILGPQLVRADVVRTFELADGTPIKLALPQFYQFASGAWRQAEPPATDNDALAHMTGTRVDVAYFPEDAALAASLLHDLDTLLARACADWDCPGEVRVPVNFEPSQAAFTNSPLSYQSLLGSLTFQTIYAGQNILVWRAVSLPTRLVGGYPADAAASEAVRRAAGIQALLVVAQQMAPQAMAHGDNTFLNALVVREAARLGLEAPQLAETKIANPLFTPVVLWALPNLSYDADPAMPDALAILNQVLAGGSLADERALLHALNAAADPTSWLAAGLGLTPEVAATRLAAASTFSVPMPPAQPPAFAPDLVLNCRSGPLLAALDGRTAPLFSTRLPGIVAQAWSPDGRRLVTSVSGRYGLVDLSAGDSAWLPRPMTPSGRPSWASTSVLAYPSPDLGADFNKDRYFPSHLVLFDAQSGQYLPEIEDAYSYLASPNGAWAAMIRYDPGTGTLILSVAPALGGSAILTATNAASPAWSPDSQALIYTKPTSTGFSLVTYSLASGQQHTILNSSDPRVPVAAGSAQWNVTAVWSADGRQLALSAGAYNATRAEGWVALMAASGEGFHILPPAFGLASAYGASFSSDGKFLAAVQYNGQAFSPRGTAVYSASDSRLRRWLPNELFSGWGPQGHTLALADEAGFSLLSDPTDANNAPRPIGPADCTGLIWRPQ